MTIAPPRKTRRLKLDRRAIVTFLQALEAAYTVREAAALAGPHWRSFYKRRAADDAFARAWDASSERGADIIRAEIRRRALEGWEEVTLDGDGDVVRRVQRFDMRALELAAKVHGLLTDRVEVTGPGGGPVELQAGYRPTTLRDVVELGAELGILEQLGYQRADVIEGEAVELPELEEGGES